MDPDRPEILEIDDIISRITALFSDNHMRGAMSMTNTRLRDNVRFNREIKARAVMRGAMERFRLTKFPPITSMDQKIRQVVPPFWLLATAMSKDATSEDRRESASRHVGERYLTLDRSVDPDHYNLHFLENPDPLVNTPEFLRIQAEAYIFVQYLHYPDKTLRQFFQQIDDKNGIRQDVTRFYDAAVEQTAPQLLALTFTRRELEVFGW